MLKSKTLEIIKSRCGHQSARFINACIVEGKLDWPPAMVTMPAIILNKTFKDMDARTQAFCLVHESIHIEELHHKFVMDYVDDPALDGIPHKYREMFLSYALDIQTNEMTADELGYKPNGVVLSSDANPYEPPGSPEWILEEADRLYRSRKWRKLIVDMYEKDYQIKLESVTKDSVVK